MEGSDFWNISSEDAARPAPHLPSLSTRVKVWRLEEKQAVQTSLWENYLE